MSSFFHSLFLSCFCSFLASVSVFISISVSPLFFPSFRIYFFLFLHSLPSFKTSSAFNLSYGIAVHRIINEISLLKKNDNLLNDTNLEWSQYFFAEERFNLKARSQLLVRKHTMSGRQPLLPSPYRESASSARLFTGQNRQKYEGHCTVTNRLAYYSIIILLTNLYICYFYCLFHLTLSNLFCL
jgi:hypothetical protein